MQMHDTTAKVVPFHPLQLDAPSPVARECFASLFVPVAQIAILAARQAHQTGTVNKSLVDIIAAWSEVAAELIKQSPDALGTPGEVQHAKKLAVRAIRQMQGYEPEAKSRAYDALYARIEQAEELSHAQCIVLYEGFLAGQAAFATYLDHCGSIAEVLTRTHRL